MSRGSGIRRNTTLAIVLTPLLLGGCIFSPDEVPIDVPDETIVPENPEDLIRALELSYRQRKVDDFEAILANDAENSAEYLFILSEATPEGESQWGWAEEVRIHNRMFEPENLPPGEPPVPSELWLQSIDITLSIQRPFEERSDLYQDQGGALSRERWLATDARYATSVFFQTQGETDFRVEGQANFVVIEDLTKEVGDAGKFLLLIWEDLDITPKPGAAEPA
ncbi:MAG: hypothetical protein ACE5G2_05155 [Candidatus Krumholzibacteriia bacterium]